VQVNEANYSRQTAVLSRFAASAARLHAVGLADGFLQAWRPSSDEDAKAQARQYLDLGLVCPSLDHDVCSIYQARPFACREYFVTSANNCAPIRSCIRLRLRGDFRGRRGESGDGSGILPEDRVIPFRSRWRLIYASAHREEPERTYDGNQIFSRAPGDLFGTVATDRAG
jgi:hypothetical protein